MATIMTPLSNRAVNSRFIIIASAMSVTWRGRNGGDIISQYSRTAATVTKVYLLDQVTVYNVVEYDSESINIWQVNQVF